MSDTPLHQTDSQQAPITPHSQNISNVTLPAHQQKILGRSNGLNFLNLEIELQAHNRTLILNPTGKQNNFIEMSKDRGNLDNFQMTDSQIDQSISGGQRLSLANVGVSVAVVLEVAGEDYLILARRPNGMLMLPSGYVDSANQKPDSKFAELALETALKELTEEIIVRVQNQETGEVNTKTYQIQASTDNYIWASVDDVLVKEFSKDSKQVQINLAPAYQADAHDFYELNYVTSDPLVLKPTNDLTFLPSLDLNQRVVIDEINLDHGFFYYLRETRSGQIVYPFRLEAQDLTGISIQHAETTPDRSGKPGDLLEVLDPEGIILAKISSNNGLLTGETFQLVDGILLPSGILTEQLVLSEVFNTKFIGVEDGKSLLPVTSPQVVGENVIKTASFETYRKLSLASLYPSLPSNL